MKKLLSIVLAVAMVLSTLVFAPIVTVNAETGVTLNANGGTVNGKATVTVTAGEKANLPYPTRDGYRFGGWFTDEDCTQAVGDTTVDGDTLYAKWKDATVFYTDFSVDDATAYNSGVGSVDAKGNSFTPLTAVLAYGANVTSELVSLKDASGNDTSLLKLSNVYSTDSYAQVGVQNLVFTDENGFPYELENNANYKIDYKLYFDTTGTWRRFWFGRGGFQSATNLSTGAVHNANYTTSFDDSTGDSFTTVSIPYGGSNSLTAATTTSHSNAWYMPNITSYTTAVYGDAKLSENWYDFSSSGTNRYLPTSEFEVVDNKFTLENDAKTFSYTYGNYFAFYNGFTGKDAIVYLDYVRITKEVNANWNANGGTVDGKTTGTITGWSGETFDITPTKEDYTFGGWFSDVECTIPVDNVLDGDVDNKTIYAKWISNLVTLDANGGLVNGKAKEEVTPGSKAELPYPTRNGYRFGGWYTDKNCTEAVGNTTVAGTTLYAKWKDATVFYSDFSITDATAFDINETSIDEAGNSFYPMAVRGGYSPSVTGTIEILEDGEGVSHTLWNLNVNPSTQTWSTIKEFTAIITDENGYPYVLENNANYKIDVKYYYDLSGNYRRLNFGRGGYQSSASITDGVVGKKGRSTDAGDKPFTAKSIPLEGSNSLAAVTDVTFDSMKKLPNGTIWQTLTYNDTKDDDIWYNSSYSNTYYLATSEYTITNNTFDIISNDGTALVTHGNYLALWSNAGHNNNIYIDYINVIKEVKTFYNATGGVLNAAETGTITGWSGDVLPTPTRKGYYFEGWYLDEALTIPAPKTFCGDTDNVTVYAKWSDATFVTKIDFETNEVLSTKYDGVSITAKDGNEYSVNSNGANTGRENGHRYVGKGSGVNGSYGQVFSVNNSTQTYNIQYAYPLNINNEFYYLNPATDYLINIDVKINLSEDRINAGYSNTKLLDIGYGPYYNGSFKYAEGLSSKDSTGTVTDGLLPVASVNNGSVVFGGTVLGTKEGGWTTVQLKLTTPDVMPKASKYNPIPEMLVLCGNATWGCDIYVDNVIIERFVNVTTVADDGTATRESHRAGDKITLPNISANADVINADGTGYTALSNKWYTDKSLTVETENEVTVPREDVVYYEDIEKIVENNANQVSYYGFEDSAAQTLGTVVDGGYLSNKALEISSVGTLSGVINGVALKKGVTYSLMFYYKSAGDTVIAINGESITLAAADTYTAYNYTFTAVGEALEIEVTNCISPIYIDTVAVSTAAFANGTAILTEEVACEINKQAMRFFFSYNIEEDGNVVVNGKNYTIAERGMYIASDVSLNGAELTEDNAYLVVSKKDNFNSCWSYKDGNVVFSNYITGFNTDDNREVVTRGFIKMTDGTVFYSEQLTRSVEYNRNAIYGESVLAEMQTTKNELAEVKHDGDVSYIFLTDIHIDKGVSNLNTTTDYQRHVEQTIKNAVTLANSDDNIDFLVIGGDTVEGYQTRAQYDKYMKIVTDTLAPCEKPVVFVRGNHDNNHNKGQGHQARVWQNEIYAQTQALFRKDYFVYDEKFYGESMYFYFDLEEKKTRVICIDNYISDYVQSGEQLEWLVNEALTVEEDGWKYVFVNHASIVEHYSGDTVWNNAFNTNLRAVISAINKKETVNINYTYTSLAGDEETLVINKDYSSYGSYVVASSCGHVHNCAMGYDSETGVIITASRSASNAGSSAFEYGAVSDDTGYDGSLRNNTDLKNADVYCFDVFNVGSHGVDRIRFGNAPQSNKTVLFEQ